MNLASYIGLLHAGEEVLAQSFRQLADGHGDEPDVFHLCHTLAKQCDEHGRRLGPVVERYGETPDAEPERFHADAMSESRSGPLGLLRDLQDLHALVGFVDTTWTVVKQAALALRDEELLAIIDDCERQTKLQQDWLSTRLKQAAPQALLVAS
ncbi:hypothetical protein D8Y23_10100 [Microbacterium enclense]|uniref:Uncharacterized protein n=1 Tax=Microbacterium enclense TaxID=993073 RepID=A0A3S3MXG0_9MICO|nr:hypothetical protein [Microbacterium enclense]RWR18242.1 hypothetical protein D8Y23_10100 [Microbacterium enclense]